MNQTRFCSGNPSLAGKQTTAWTDAVQPKAFHGGSRRGSRNKGCKDGALNPDWAMRWDITGAWFSVLINKIKISMYSFTSQIFSHGCGMSHAIGGARYAVDKKKLSLSLEGLSNAALK